MTTTLLPEPIDTGTVIGKMLYDDGTPAVGYVNFTPRVPRMLSPESDPPAIVKGRTRRVALDSGGEFSIDLIATDDTDLNPHSWTYLVQVEYHGVGPVWEFDIEVPQDQITNLTLVAPAAPSEGTVTGAVVTVNGDPGPDVVLSAADVGADPAGSATAAGMAAVVAANAYTDAEIAGIEAGADWGDIGGTLSNQTDLQVALDAKANSSALAVVAATGDYDDLSNTPTLGTAAAEDVEAFMPAGSIVEVDDIGNWPPTTEDPGVLYVLTDDGE